MDRIRIRGGRRLSGSVPISGAKNAVLALMPAALLGGPLTLTNVPDLADTATMAALLAQHGVVVDRDRTAGRVSLSGAAASLEAPYDIVRKMRASVLVLGPLLARYGQARVSLPGGCAIGTRPVDLHLKGLEAMGATIDLEGGYIEARAPAGGLRGARILFPSVSVGATENLLLAAVLARGESELVNAAREPEIEDLALCLMRMGARIEGIGTGRLHVQGVDSLAAATHRVLADRIEAGTYACAAAITGGELLLEGARLEHLGAVARVLREAGVGLAEEHKGLRVTRLNGLHGVDVQTETFPGFATDMQAQFMALMSIADGASMITETIFENRFMHVPELMRMGARINYHGASAIVRGVPKLSGAPVMATDLRASVSLILAGLAAEGETIVNRVYHLDRGYERVEAKLAAVGADIERIPG
ncbi:UDP-N-acetylglucosamine 1-carboxyvinyltransferase [Siccirubricoccus deserti]|uniref:UDP-N-acetylglucosamine 1-carboxyvinyltransferase n=1 Tax=Siccirubricoccus deserti TaxID=2013562 RepID=A0A9X0R1E9_9PROT|nr:UDP-N-acetylglucosamine 1-carboxyvinyltransferase [Siccirubricoccus deserti]MBC4017719.1 UDP-N-acetylglucosamine 1-carboxyvinyltransferase [Siccirubricoccus deserti]GGC40215.1 UDP-N-acetylglucosamine 1-carboxyvinyltransferase [Siccirubricoccus deserti]